MNLLPPTEGESNDRLHAVAAIEKIRESVAGSEDSTRKALEWLLALTAESRRYKVPERRRRAIEALGRFYTVDQWRRPDGPEYELMREFAKTLTAQPGPSYRKLRDERTFFFDSRGVMLREEGLYEVEALSDGVEAIKHGWEYLADPRPDVMTVEPLLGVLDVHSEYQMGLIAHFKIRRLAKGERHTYAAKLNIHSDVPARPMFLLRPITEVRNFVIRLHFEKDPSLVWRFSDLEAYQLAPIEKPILDALVKPENGWYAWRFKNLRPYLCYGLAWRL